MSAQAGATPEVNIEVKGLDVSFIAGEVLTGHLYKAVYLSAERTISLVATSTNMAFIGFLQSGDVGALTTIAIGDNVSVRIDGITYVVAQSSFTMGERLMVADSSGRVDTATDNNLVVAIALESASAINHVVSALIVHCPIKGDNT
jgi:hypothetical protein